MANRLILTNVVLYEPLPVIPSEVLCLSLFDFENYLHKLVDKVTNCSWRKHLQMQNMKIYGNEAEPLSKKFKRSHTCFQKSLLNNTAKQISQNGSYLRQWYREAYSGERPDMETA